jgi:predicted transposase/invertase (TIGR01784 family)
LERSLQRQSSPPTTSSIAANFYKTLAFRLKTFIINIVKVFCFLGTCPIWRSPNYSINYLKTNERSLPMADTKNLTPCNSQPSEEPFTGKLPYTLTNDFFFKAFLQNNEIALRGLLCALLSMKPDEITSVTITNPISDGDAIDDKTMVLDIKLVLNNEQIINLEMQVANLGNWPERSLTYLCRMFDQLKSGDDYQNVKKTLHIGIMDFTPEDFPKVLYSNYFLYNLENKHKYSDKFGIYMLQLNQIGDPKDEKERPELYYWAQFFKATTWEEIKMLAQKMNPLVKVLSH